MRWLKNILVTGLLLAAVVVALATVFSDHSADYGKRGAARRVASFTSPRGR